MASCAPLIVLLSLVSLSAAAAEPSPPAPPESEPARPPLGIRGVAQAAVLVDSKYRIGVEDLLLVSVWREPDLTREVPVRPDGKISLPLIQDVPAAGLTPEELGNEIRTRLQEFLSAPAVTVVVREVNSQKVYLLGEVVRPGAVLMRSEVRLLQAISMAGGITPFGGRNGVVIYRRSDAGEKVLKVSYRDIVAGKSPEGNLVLSPGDTVVVH